MVLASIALFVSGEVILIVPIANSSPICVVLIKLCCLVLCCLSLVLVLPCLILVLSRLGTVLSCLILSRLVVSHLVMYCLRHRLVS